jgi:hypothetical protein
MDADIIKFPGASNRPKTRTYCSIPEEKAPPVGSLSVSAKNSRLRAERRKAWSMAGAAVQYWRARLEIDDAIERAQRLGIPEGRSHPREDTLKRLASDDRQSMVDKWRAALTRQLLTPAHDANSVKWKQTKLASERQEGGYYGFHAKPERIERAIAEDLAFLAAHPTSRSQRRRGEGQA